MEIENTIREHWPDIKLKLKEKYPQLTEGDLSYRPEFSEEFLENLQMKTGKTRESLNAELNAMALDKS